ncbi:MAG: transglycosylase SLT domain-containing protein [Pseudomonadota bacterium]
MFLTTLPAAAGADASARSLFEQSWDAVVDGEWPFTDDEVAALKKYPLWIDLLAAKHSAELQSGSFGNAATFQHAAPDLPPVRRLRYRYATALAREQRWDEFFAVYGSHYANHGDPALACKALTAALNDHGNWSDADVKALARKLWLVGRSQHDDCDPAFRKLKQNGVLDSAAFAERYSRAIEAGNFSLAGYLARNLDSATQADAQRWRDAKRATHSVLLNRATRTELSDDQLAYAVRRLSLSDPEKAHAIWHSTTDRTQAMDPDLRAQVLRYLALAGAQDGLPQAIDWFDDVPPSAQDEKFHAWHARAAIRAEQWTDVVRAIARMPMAQSVKPRWRYWEAAALIRSGQREAGLSLMSDLATDRSYHGFLAADLVDQPYRFDHRPIPVDDALVESFRARFEWRRVEELYRVGQVARARAELATLSRSNTPAELIALGALAHELGWHHEAIRLVAAGSHLDDLEIRFPLAHVKHFRPHANRRGLSDTWVMALARSESLFDPTVRSSAGARGVMQLIPTTARRTARDNGLTLSSDEALHDPATNIAIGTAHLAELEARFQHRALSTAAYNAGAHRITRWAQSDIRDPLIWIELIPYDETRDYVQKVLFADIVFQWRSERSVDRLSRYLKPLPSQASVARAARL